MKTKKILLILLFPFIAEFITACCDCPPLIDKLYSNRSFTITHLEDNQDSLPVSPVSDSVIKTAYTMRLLIRAEETACLWPEHSLFFSQANATFDCFCDAPLFNAKDSITGITIQTLQAFDATHPAGSDISDYFNEYVGDTYVPITTYLQQAAGSFRSGNNIFDFVINLRLIHPPANAGQYYTFKVRLTLSDNRILEQEASPIKLY